MPSYTDLLTAVASAVVLPTTDTGLTTIFPTWINQAEGRIYRELDMLVANVRDTGVTVSGNRTFNLPTNIGTFLILDALNIITPAGTAPASGTRNPVRAASLEVLDWTWPSSTGSGVPEVYAYFTQNTYLVSAQAQTQIAFGPWPDAAYTVEVVGKIQPAALSASNTNTFLTDNLFDVLFAAMMVNASAWLQNYGGSGVDNPQMPSTWEQTYQKHRDSAATWEARKRYGGVSWTSKNLEPMAQAQRG